jgi:hypothetical protein
MAEYIEREAALAFQNEVEPLLCRNVVTHDIMSATKDADMVKYLQSIPAADVRPVVLCLHCVNWETSWAPNCGKEYGHFCPMVGTVTRADWFCTDGEKREES